jgi:hypothetical protein
MLPSPVRGTLRFGHSESRQDVPVTATGLMFIVPGEVLCRICKRSCSGIGLQQFSNAVEDSYSPDGLISLSRAFPSRRNRICRTALRARLLPLCFRNLFKRWQLLCLQL